MTAAIINIGRRVILMAAISFGVGAIIGLVISGLIISIALGWWI